MQNLFTGKMLQGFV